MSARPYRFELRCTAVAHPWRIRHHPSGVSEPRIVEGVELFDNETRTAIRTGMKTAIKAPEVRALNGLAPVTVQRVTGALRRAGVSIGTWCASGQVRGWGSYTRGIRVRFDEFGRVALDFVSGHHSRHTPDDELRALERAADALEAAGVPILSRDLARAVFYV